MLLYHADVFGTIERADTFHPALSEVVQRGFSGQFTRSDGDHSH